MESFVDLTAVKDNPYQPRTTDDVEHIEKLARSIAADGLLQTPKARSADGVYQLAFGHSRRKAFEWLSANWSKQGFPERYEKYTLMPLEIQAISDEDMYRYAVTENVQRKDLAPTELARAMKQYMEEFHADSKTTAELFGMNDATVRGMVRLLDLPVVVQEKLDDGTITQGTARLFHSMQKIAPEKTIVETLKRIEKEKTVSLPEEVIETEIDRLDNVYELWNDGHREGKPRGGYHGWLLDMKNFPVHLLPELDPSTTSLPPNLLAHLVHPPVCSACPFYTKMRGSHYCGMKACFQRKEVAWKAYALEQASKRIGIPVYAEADGGWQKLDYSDKPLFEKKHKDLRLMPGIGYQGFPGLKDDLVLVVATGDALGKMRRTSTSTKGGKKSEKEKADMRAMRIYRARRLELMWEYTAAAQGMFESVPDPVLKKLCSWHYIMIDDRIPDKRDAKGEEYQRRALVWRLIVGLSSYFTRQSLTEQLSNFEKVTGARAPKSLHKRAAEWQAEIAATAQPVSVETKKAKKQE